MAEMESLDSFLAPLRVDTYRLHALAHKFARVYKVLAATSTDQFLPTPISVLPTGREQGRFLAIDIGGTNLRVAFAELSGVPDEQTRQPSVHRTFEKSWPIAEHLKNEKAEDLFAWIGLCIAEVVRQGFQGYDSCIDLGVTFSFPMIQRTLSEATLMSMGKGFAITSDLDLAKQLLDGYQKANSAQDLPSIKIAAITNDSVATLIALAYRFNPKAKSRPVMGMIVGTGTNATLPLKISSLHSSKQPMEKDIMADTNSDNAKIVVNTEWSINGAASPLRELRIVTRWDSILDAEAEAPGFQPFEYMTAGRYLGELGRIVIVDYFTRVLGFTRESLPPKLLMRNNLATAFFGNLRASDQPEELLTQLARELPSDGSSIWTPVTVNAVVKVAKAIEERAAGLTAAAVIGLLAFAEEIELSTKAPVAPSNSSLISTSDGVEILYTDDVEDLVVGYTGGCINYFQDYLADCRGYLESIMALEAQHQGRELNRRIMLEPCNDGGLDGAGILAGTVKMLA